MWRGVLIAGILVFAVLGYFYREEALYGYEWMPLISTTRLIVDDFALNVRVARTPEERARGLTDYDSIPPKSGMLFVYEEDDYYAVTSEWMRFPIDILWIRADGLVVEIRENVLPHESYTIYPRAAARYILQLNAGTVQRQGLDTASIVDLRHLK